MTTKTQRLIERIWPTTITNHKSERGFDYSVVHNDAPRWVKLVRDYGWKRAMNTQQYWTRIHIAMWVLKMLRLRVDPNPLLDDYRDSGELGEAIDEVMGESWGEENYNAVDNIVQKWLGMVFDNVTLGELVVDANDPT